MKRKIALTFLIGLALTAIGCGNKKTDTDVTNNDTASIDESNVLEEVEDNEKVEPGLGEIVEELIESFEEKTLDISDDLLLIQKPTTYLNYWDENTNEEKLNYSMQGLAILNEGYEKLQTALDEHTRLQYETFNEDYNSSLEFFDGVADTGYDGIWSSNSEITITRADSNILSFYEYGYSYLGGAHPNEGLYGYNYYSESGEEVSLTDVVTDYDGLYNVVMDYFINDCEEGYGLFENYTDTIYKDFYQQETDEYGISYKVNWYMDKNALHIYFNQYDIAPYAMGPIELTFNYEDYPELLSSEYFSVQDTYAKKITTWQTIDLDFDNDGDIETLEVETEQVNPDDEDGIYLNINYTDNGETKTCTKEEWYALGDLYLIKNSDGNYYLYADIKEYNDYHTLEIFDLNGSQPVYLASANGLYDMDIIDVNNFYLATRDDVLGTYTNASLYYVGVDGIPVRKDDKAVIFSYDTSNIFENGFHKETYNYITLKQDISGEDQNILSGTQWQPIEIINDETVILVSPNGKKLELKIEPDTENGWGYLINGINQDELFDGIFYAG